MRWRTHKPASNHAVIFSIVITVIALIAVVFMVYYGEKEPDVFLSGRMIHISGIYGLDIDLDEVENISLLESSMQDIGVGHRNNGYGGFGQTLKGHFDSSKLGRYLLFVQSKTSPTVWIERGDQEDVYISFVDGTKTRTLYQTLSDAFLTH